MMNFKLSKAYQVFVCLLLSGQIHGAGDNNILDQPANWGETHRVTELRGLEIV